MLLQFRLHSARDCTAIDREDFLQSSGWIFWITLSSTLCYLNGFRVYVLRSTLEHDSSYSDIGSLPIWRLRNIILARTLYVKRAGAF